MTKAEFTRAADGHFVGTDGFVVPKNFEEFIARFPGYVLRWVRLAVRYPLVRCQDDALDWASELTLRLMQLSHRSAMRQNGATDVIECFDPARSGGATSVKFFSYIDLCLRNRFRSLLAKQRKDAIRDDARRAFNFSLSPQDAADTCASPEDPEDYAHRHSLRIQELSHRNEKQQKDRELLEQFRAFVEAHDSSVLPLMNAIAICGTLSEAARSLRLTNRKFVSDRNRLGVLRECFEKGEIPPPRRKPYTLKRDLLKANAV